MYNQINKSKLSNSNSWNEISLFFIISINIIEHYLVYELNDLFKLTWSFFFVKLNII